MAPTTYATPVAGLPPQFGLQRRQERIRRERLDMPDGVERRQPRERAVQSRHGDGTVDRHHRRSGQLEQLVVERQDLRPAG